MWAVTWRRFSTLVRGLSPRSLWHLSQRPQDGAPATGGVGGGAPVAKLDAQATGRYLASLKGAA